MLFAVEATGVAGQLAAAPDDAMAGDEDAQRVAADGCTDLLSGDPVARSGRQVAVGDGLAVRNLLDLRPDPGLELLAVRGQGQLEFAARPGQVLP